MKFDAKKYFSKIGRKGGLSTSPAKSMAARLNGKKGGHPRNFKKTLDNLTGLGYTPNIRKRKEAKV